MADHKYELNDIGLFGVNLTAKDEGPTIHAREGKQDEGLNRKVYQALSGLANLDPYTVRPVRKNQVWAQVVPVPHPSQMESSLVIPNNAKSMLRHRAMSYNGETIIFRQGAGDIVRFGDFGNEEEWVMLSLEDVIISIPLGTRDTESPVVREGWVVVTPIDISQESSDLLEIVDNTHVFNREWATGSAVHDVLGKWSDLDIYEDDQLFYPARTITEISINDTLYHAVKVNDVLAVKTNWGY